MKSNNQQQKLRKKQQKSNNQQQKLRKKQQKSSNQQQRSNFRQLKSKQLRFKNKLLKKRYSVLKQIQLKKQFYKQEKLTNHMTSITTMLV